MGSDSFVSLQGQAFRNIFTPEEIADKFGHLSLAQVYAALAFYHANQAEIELALADEVEQVELLAEEVTITG